MCFEGACSFVFFKAACRLWFSDAGFSLRVEAGYSTSRWLGFQFGVGVQARKFVGLKHNETSSLSVAACSITHQLNLQPST